MQHTTFRRVLNSLSPKKTSQGDTTPQRTPERVRRPFQNHGHSPTKPKISAPTNVTRTAHKTPPTPQKPPELPSPHHSTHHPVTAIFQQEALPDDPSVALEVQYERYIARISTRAQQTNTPPTAAAPDAPTAPAVPNEQPQPQPFVARNPSRIHRRAMRDLTLDPEALAAHGKDKENSAHNSLEPPGTDGDPTGTKPTAPAYSETVTSATNTTTTTTTTRASSLPPMYVDVDPRLHFHSFQPIGKGGSGSVYFATPHSNPHMRVALKRVTPSTRAKSKALENEIRTMHALRHPNIVQCHEAYSYEGAVWIVMEAMDVGCLTHVLDFLRAKGYLLSESHIAYILRETLLGLWTMHSHRCMHRDIKSDNILVSSTGEIKLGDFEYTGVLTEDTPKRNTIVGTAWWMAPETVRSSYYDYGADVWSIGILSVECAEWVPPLFGMESAKAMEVIKSGATIQGFKRPDMWSVEFADFVRGCLTRDRSLRYTVPDLLRHPFLGKACSQTQIANVFRAVRGMGPISDMD